jgi:hypothetical protein
MPAERVAMRQAREIMARVPLSPCPWLHWLRCGRDRFVRRLPSYYSASARTTRRGQRPWHVQTLLAREPGDLAIDRSATAAGPHREGEEP